jgi:Tol biopolymer transport system component
VLIAAMLPPPPAHASFPGRNGQIAYGLYENSPSEEGLDIFPFGIEAIFPGKPPRRSLRFTHDPVVPGSCIEAPSYSADGTLIAFNVSWFTGCEPYPPPAQAVPTAQSVFIMSATGTGVRRVTEKAGAVDSDPGFSPGGDRIVFSRSAERQTQIYTVGTDGGDLRRLTSGTGRNLSPRYSPDGRHIVFDSRNGIEEINADGSGRHILVADHGRYKAAEADFSPDGKLIAFVKATFQKGWVYVAKANGRAARRVSSAALKGNSCFHSVCAPAPIFSPDGRHVMFVEFNGEHGSKLIEVPVSGGGRPRVQPTPRQSGVNVVRPSWQPQQ